ncbi:hypothetical protein EHS25_004182 [Saitozyma podzolica]|uniref:G-patch domain-containing protein n=1 Tax=Saitozyma podzolica TaxID=1890683 RepID=A0A427YTI0_9TREE|nr:hypothetical protein EHS25_004182 [Saitozyma podzolica]
MAQPVAVDPHAPPAGMSDANKALGVMRPITQPPPAPPADFDYADVSTLATTGKVACLLCQRQFKTEEMLRKHTAQSDLHKARIKPGFTDILEFRASVTNLLDTAICQSGKQRKNAVGSATSGSSNSGETAEQSKYRDRAAERREAFNQPDKPVLDRNAGVSSFKRKFAEAPKPPPPPAAPGVEPGKDEANKGNLLLAKMGWKSGTGLGKEGEGRVDPVMVQQFESRAGLGASKGVEAGKWQGEGGFKKRAMDMAEQRYHQS